MKRTTTILLAAMLAASSAVASVRPAAAGVDPDLLNAGNPPPGLSYEDRGVWVEMLNQRLAEAGYHPNAGSSFGNLTRHAVFAFQKVHGLETDGVFTPEMWDLLDTAPKLQWRPEKDRVEVDLAKQVLYLVEDHKVRYIIPISSGNGGTFVNASGRVVAARTPEGRFSFDRSIEGMRISYLGALYNPFYFRGGYAIHGSPSVPNYPASHGCVRVTNWDMDLLKQHFDIGETVYVYGLNTPEPPGELVRSLGPTRT